VDDSQTGPNAAAGELRFDALTREWVNVVGHRQDRPNLPSSGCPFCIGGLEAPDPYVVRAFPNRWPSLTPGAPIDLTASEIAGVDVAPARGASEVVLYSPEHSASLASIGERQVRRVVDLWAERTEALLARPDITYVLVFENRGPEVGATIHHPHGQIYGYGWLPPVARRLADVARDHGDPIAAEVEAETKSGARVVARADGWIAYVPFASAYPYGVRVAPEHDRQRIAEFTDSERDGLARILIEVTARFDALFPETAAREVPFPYLMWMHQAPQPRPDPWLRFFVQFAPPWRAAGVPRYVASGELGSGTFANPVRPEDAAAALRDARP
jgi:UDPglucose--hexose-1-phosphate uridylyltransferase